MSDAGLRIAATCTIARPRRASPSGRAGELAPAAESRHPFFPVARERAARLVQDLERRHRRRQRLPLVRRRRRWSRSPSRSTASPSSGRPTAASTGAPVAALMTGNGTNALAPGEVLRAVDLPAHALRARTRATARSRSPSSAAPARSSPAASTRTARAVFAVTAATLTSRRCCGSPSCRTPRRCADAVVAATGYYTDPLGAADWRREVSVRARARRSELSAGSAA